jgi:aldehyde:ferredoxin oxidoreductase
VPNGYWGKILRVDLTNSKVTVEENDDNFYRRYMGGAAMMAQYLL